MVYRITQILLFGSSLGLVFSWPSGPTSSTGRWSSTTSPYWPPSTTGSTPSTSSPSICEPIPKCSGSLKPQLLAASSCSQYWECTRGILMYLSCPNGLEFSSELNECVLPEDAHCNSDPTSTPTYLTTTYTPSICESIPHCSGETRPQLLPATNCSDYWECTRGILMYLSCPNGLKFSSELNECVLPEDANCSGHSKTNKLGANISPNMASSTSTTPSPSICEPIPHCSGSIKPQLLPATSCTKYWECSRNIRMYLSCPNGLEFSSELNECVLPEDAHCYGYLTPVSTTSHYSTSSTTPDPSLCEPVPHCSGSVVPHLLPSLNCSQYWECTRGILMYLSCPNGLQFSSALNECVLPEDSDCNGRGWFK